MAVNSNEIIKLDRKDGMLTVEANLYMAPLSEEGKSGYPPLKPSPYDRFFFQFLDFETKTITKANLPIADVPLFYSEMEAAINDLHDFKNAPKSANSSAVYTENLTVGKFAGRTVADILIAGEKDDLIKTKEWFESNLKKYPGNKKFIDLIAEGVKLLDEGKLSNDTKANVVAPQYVIYKSPTKYFRDKDEKGRNKCYELEIVFNAERNYPFAIKITNFFAPLDGNLIKMSEKTTPVVKTANLTATEACFLLRQMKCSEEIFRIAKGTAIWERVEAERFVPTPVKTNK